MSKIAGAFPIRTKATEVVGGLSLCHWWFQLLGQGCGGGAQRKWQCLGPWIFPCRADFRGAVHGLGAWAGALFFPKVCTRCKTFSLSHRRFRRGVLSVSICLNRAAAESLLPSAMKIKGKDWYLWLAKLSAPKAMEEPWDNISQVRLSFTVAPLRHCSYVTDLRQREVSEALMPLLDIAAEKREYQCECFISGIGQRTATVMF